jgi:hypothetical protein
VRLTWRSSLVIRLEGAEVGLRARIEGDPCTRYGSDSPYGGPGIGAVPFGPPVGMGSLCCGFAVDTAEGAPGMEGLFLDGGLASCRSLMCYKVPQ